MSYLGIILTFVFVNNIVLAQLLGLCSGFGATVRPRSTLQLGIAITVVSTLSVLIAWVMDRLVLEPLGIDFLRTIVVIFSAAGVAQLIDLLLPRVSRSLSRSYGVFFSLVVANCSVVGISLIVLQRQYGPLQSLVAGASGGAGAMLALMFLSTIRERLQSEWVPRALRGMPITLITAGLMAMTLLAFDRAFLGKLIG